MSKKNNEKFINIIGEKPCFRFPLYFGAAILVIFVVGFSFWMFFFPLDSAAIAEGTVKVYSKQQVVEHLEGGIVKHLYVREGNDVKKGEPLVELAAVDSYAQLEKTKKELLSRLAEEARLKAEVNHQAKIHFPLLLREAKFATARKIRQGQEHFFKQRRQAYLEQIKTLDLKSSGLNEEVKALSQQAEAGEKEIAKMQAERKAIAKLVASKHMEKMKLIRLERQISHEQGERHEVMVNIARAKQKIADIQLAKIRFKSHTAEDIQEELNKVQEEVAVLEEQYKQFSDQVRRSMIRAPVSGRVVELKVHTEGDVIKPGETLMAIVPAEQNYIIEAKIDPMDIDVVHKGLKAYIQLTVLKTRHMPTISGEVLHVSADAIEDKKLGTYHYLAELKIDPKSLAAIPNAKLYPGMPVQVMVVTNRQTMWNYFFLPVRDSFNRAFKED